MNRRTNNGATGTFTVDNKNQITATPCGSAFYYDANGNMISNFCSFSALTYDNENRLTMVSSDVYHTFRSSFVYDGLGRLRKRVDYSWQTAGTGPSGGPLINQPSWVATNTVLYIYDGFRVIQERNTNSVPTVSYTRGTDLSGTMQRAGGIGGLLARSSGYSSGNWTTNNFYFADGNGNITYMLDGSQAMVASYRYDPFGNTISSSGTLASANIYRFSSKEIHANSGMYYYGFRFYDPNLQRWVNRDPVQEEGGINLYAFLGNNPADEVDGLGLAPKSPDLTPPPANMEGGPYNVWCPDKKNSRGGVWRNAKGQTASWDPVHAHWDRDLGKGKRIRYNSHGVELREGQHTSPRATRPLPFSASDAVVVAVGMALDQAAENYGGNLLSDATLQQMGLTGLGMYPPIGMPNEQGDNNPPSPYGRYQTR